MYLCSQLPHGISQTTPRRLLAGTASFPEARTVNNLCFRQQFMFFVNNLCF